METILVIAHSGRMLAQAAKKAGLKSLVIDLFADADTQHYAEDFRRIESLDKQDLAPAVDYFIERYAVAHVIYGSGFECHPESLYFLSSRLGMLGNHPEVFARQLDKRAFFSTLDQLNIPYPEVVFGAPDSAGDWLVKPMKGQGGVGIKRYQSGDCIEVPVYWQKFQTGTQHSALFLADGRQGRVIGFNRQCSVRLSGTQEFFFSSVINCCDLPDAHKSNVTDWLKEMISAFSLKGLNSLDFVYSGDQCYVLEINPRPSASMQLYEEDLLSGHIQVCAGEDIAAWPRDTARSKAGKAGYQVVYAERDVIIPDQFEWPDWCVDLPQPGNMCRAGQPFCSIMAHSENSQSVAEQLLAKQQIITSRLERF